eukprot:CAMPEP_0117429334 /NCGR_PEP_ID=MMETSP0758-20121206/8895_1 /TAXON_ID=63605 /ORGANISM="Percolomonas cosmopolitus, Strain AE-1 (ATCC 50343)" /LENGTH=61 /DNA_ID=CAMNT_0005216293 /DNA_START=118 /DNA_END=300 /DNA_ORIENTATION=+
MILPEIMLDDKKIQKMLREKELSRRFFLNKSLEEEYIKGKLGNFTHLLNDDEDIKEIKEET